MNYNKLTLMTLISITVVGMIAIPFGMILIAIAVIVGNSISAPHVHLMTTFEKPLNAVVLLVGGYILQGMLIYFSLKIILKKHPIRLSQGFTL